MSVTLRGHTDTVLTVSVLAEAGGGGVVSGAEGGELRLWTPEGSPRGAHSLPSGDDVTSIACSQQRPQLLYVAAGCEIVLLDVRALGEPVHTFSFNEDEINQLALSHKEDHLAACDDSGNIKVISLFERKVFKTLRGHENICATLAFHPRRPWDLVSGGYDSHLIQWDFSKGRPVCTLNMEEVGEPDTQGTTYLVNPPFVHSVAISPAGDLVACGTERATVPIFRCIKKGFNHLDTLQGHSRGVSQVHFPQFQRSHLLSAGNDGKILFWNLEDLISARSPVNGISHSETDTSPLEGDTRHVEGAEAAASNTNTRSRTKLEPCEKIDHGEKINWLTTAGAAGKDILVVADNTENITIYPYPH